MEVSFIFHKSGNIIDSSAGQRMTLKNMTYERKDDDKKISLKHKIDGRFEKLSKLESGFSIFSPRKGEGIVTPKGQISCGDTGSLSHQCSAGHRSEKVSSAESPCSGHSHSGSSHHHHHHHHGHSHSGHHHHHGVPGQLGLAFFLNLFFAGFEFLGGMWTGSLAITSDAVHDLGDSFAIGIAWYLEKKSKDAGGPDFSYGMRRLSLASALLTGVFLLGGSIVVFFNAVPRLWQSEMPHTDGMVLFAILGVAVNGFAAFRMMRGSSHNERMVYLHLMEDVLGWVAVLFGALLMKVFPLPWIDPLLAILIALWVFWNAFKNLRQTIQIFLQGTPSQFSISSVEKKILEIPEIKSLHHSHVWSIDGENHIFTSHLQLGSDVTMDRAHQLKIEVKKMLKNEFLIFEATLEIEWPHHQCHDPFHSNT